MGSGKKLFTVHVAARACMRGIYAKSAAEAVRVARAAFEEEGDEQFEVELDVDDAEAEQETDRG